MSQLVSIPPATHVGTVSLTVADMARSLRYYADVLGLHQVAGGDGRVQVGGADGAPLLELVEVRGAPPKPQPRRRASSFCATAPFA